MCKLFRDFYLETRKDMGFKICMLIMAVVSIILMLIGFIGMYKYPTDYAYAITAIVGISGLPWPIMVAIFFCIGKCAHTPEPLADLYGV
jgi:multisubunit Na+/H+ antiporter MnhG subunit